MLNLPGQWLLLSPANVTNFNTTSYMMTEVTRRPDARSPSLASRQAGQFVPASLQFSTPLRALPGDSPGCTVQLKRWPLVQQVPPPAASQEPIQPFRIAPPEGSSRAATEPTTDLTG